MSKECKESKSWPNLYNCADFLSQILTQEAMSTFKTACTGSGNKAKSARLALYTMFGCPQGARCNAKSIREKIYKDNDPNCIFNLFTTGGIEAVSRVFTNLPTLASDSSVENITDAVKDMNIDDADYAAPAEVPAPDIPVPAPAPAPVPAPAPSAPRKTSMPRTTGKDLYETQDIRRLIEFMAENMTLDEVIACVRTYTETTEEPAVGSAPAPAPVPAPAPYEEETKGGRANEAELQAEWEAQERRVREQKQREEDEQKALELSKEQEAAEQVQQAEEEFLFNNKDFLYNNGIWIQGYNDQQKLYAVYVYDFKEEDWQELQWMAWEDIEDFITGDLLRYVYNVDAEGQELYNQYKDITPGTNFQPWDQTQETLQSEGGWEFYEKDCPNPGRNVTKESFEKAIKNCNKKQLSYGKKIKKKAMKLNNKKFKKF